MTNLLPKAAASRIIALSLLFAAAALSETTTSISPGSALAGASDFTLTVSGTGFPAITGFAGLRMLLRPLAACRRRS